MRGFLIGIVLSQIFQGYKKHAKEVLVNRSKHSFDILFFLYKQGFILNFSCKGNFYYLVHLKYSLGHSVIKDFKILSKPSKRVYCSFLDLKKYKSFRGIYVVSTSRGLLSSTECLYYGLGGEMLCFFF